MKQDHEYTFVVAAEITLNITVSAASLEDAVDKAKAAPLMRCTSGELDASLGDAEHAELVEAFRDEDDLLEAAREVWME